MAKRTQNYLRQLKGSVFFKLLGITASFLLTPIMLKFLGIEKFGVWSTMLSFFSWITFFDLGISNGMRNKTAEALAREDYDLANTVVSTSYVCLGLISFTIFLLFLIFSNLVSWQTIFNVHAVSDFELKTSVVIAIFFILLNFVLSIVRQVIHSAQKTALVVFEQCLSNSLSLVFVFVLSRICTSNLIVLSLVYGLSITLSCGALSVWFYKSHHYLMPRISSFRLAEVRNILGLGLKFFLIQASFLVIFTTDKMIIAQLFGAKEVTPYDILFKLFSIVSICHSIIMTPLWSTFTEAYINKDINWVSGIIKKLGFLMIPFSAAISLLALSAPWIIKIWMRQDLRIDTSLTIMVGAFIAISIWSNIYAYFLNGINAVNLQLCCLAAGSAVNIPLAIFFGRYLSLGVKGVVLSSILSLGIFAVAGPIQTYSILRKERLNLALEGNC